MNTTHRISYSDIETGPESEEIIRAMTEPYEDFDEAAEAASIRKEFVTARDPIKGPTFLADKLAKAKADHAEGLAEYWKKAFDNAALSPLTGRILLIGVRENGKNRFFTAKNPEDEKAMLSQFLAYVTEMVAQGGNIIGFNWEDFDLGFIIARCMKHRLNWQILRSGRYMAAVFTDILNVWRGGNRQKFISLDKLALFLNTKHRKNGDGGEFAKLFAEDDPKALIYAGNDLIMTEEVAQACGIPCPAATTVTEEDVPFGESTVAA